MTAGGRQFQVADAACRPITQLLRAVLLEITSFYF